MAYFAPIDIRGGRNDMKFAVYLFAMALVTYLIRMLPLVLVKKKIKDKFILSFLYYIPYAV